MVGYIFTYGVDGLGVDESPVLEEGCYLNYQKALDRLIELNKDCLDKDTLIIYDEGYYENYYPASDLELKEAESNADWDRFKKLMSKHYRQLTLKEYCEKYCVNNTLYHTYSINEVVIYE